MEAYRENFSADLPLGRSVSIPSRGTASMYYAAPSFSRTQSQRFSVPPSTLSRMNSLVRARISAAREYGREETSLSEETESMRQELARNRELSRSWSQQQLSQDNRRMMRRLSSAKGRDQKLLSDEQMLARKQQQQRLSQRNQEHQQFLDEHRRSYRERVRSARQQGRDVKQLSPETQAARVASARRRQSESDAQKLALALENQAMRIKLENAKPRSSTSLSEEQEAAREAARLQVIEEKRQAAKQLGLGNIEMQERLNRAKGRDQKALSPEVEAARAEMAQLRNEHREIHRRNLSSRNEEFGRRLMSTGARVDHKMTPQENQEYEETKLRWTEERNRRHLATVEEACARLQHQALVLKGVSSAELAALKAGRVWKEKAIPVAH